jgi:hypothetical protein
MLLFVTVINWIQTWGNAETGYTTRFATENEIELGALKRAVLIHKILVKLL